MAVIKVNKELVKQTKTWQAYEVEEWNILKGFS